MMKKVLRWQHHREDEARIIDEKLEDVGYVTHGAREMVAQYNALVDRLRELEQQAQQQPTEGASVNPLMTVAEARQSAEHYRREHGVKGGFVLFWGKCGSAWISELRPDYRPLGTFAVAEDGACYVSRAEEAWMEARWMEAV